MVHTSTRDTVALMHRTSLTTKVKSYSLMTTYNPPICSPSRLLHSRPLCGLEESYFRTDPGNQDESLLLNAAIRIHTSNLFW